MSANRCLNRFFPRAMPLAALAFLAAGLLGAAAPALADRDHERHEERMAGRDGRGYMLDNRYGHNQYYPPRGIYAHTGAYHVTAELPSRAGEFEYRIRHPREAYERVAAESALTSDPG